MLLFPLFVRVARLFPPWLAHHLGTSLWRIVRARTRAPLPAAYICKLQICEFAPQQNLSFCLRQVIWWLPSNSRGGGESDGFHTHKIKKRQRGVFSGPLGDTAVLNPSSTFHEFLSSKAPQQISTSVNWLRGRCVCEEGFQLKQITYMSMIYREFLFYFKLRERGLLGGGTTSSQMPHFAITSCLLYPPPKKIMHGGSDSFALVAVWTSYFSGNTQIHKF